MLLRLVLVSAFLLAVGSVQAQTSPTLFVEGGGASGLYAIGAEQVLFRSANDAQRFSVRAGVGFWKERDPFLDGRSETFLSVPLAATASFSLPLIPALLETTGGVVVAYEQSAYVRSGAGIDALPYGEVALRANVTRSLSARVGAVVGGRHDFVTGGAIAPVIGLGYSL